MNSVDDEADFEADLTSYGATSVGQVRKNNQDQYLIARLSKSMQVTSTSISTNDRLFGRAQGEVLLVADGMGGHAGGERASELAIEHLVKKLLGRVHWHFQGEENREQEFIEELQKMLRDAHARILHESSRHADRRGMGTTLTMAYLVWPKLYVLHAGDSRCYLIRDGKAMQLTNDHTLARQMVESGGLSPEDEADSKWSNVLVNVLGGRDDGNKLHAEVHTVDLEPEDALVLCSDGLHRYVNDEILADIVDSYRSLPDVCHDLIDLANESGGQDNITVIVSRPNATNLAKTTWLDPNDNGDANIASRETVGVDDEEQNSNADTNTEADNAETKDGDFHDDSGSSSVDPLDDTLPED